MRKPATINFLGVRVHAVTRQQTLALIKASLTISTKPYLIFTPNPEIIVQAHRSPTYAQILNQADLNLPDGIGLVWFSGKQLRQRVSGSDVLPQLLQACQTNQWSVGVCLPKTSLSAPAQIQHYFEKTWQLTPQIFYADDIVQPQPDVVIVTLGFPQQEQWSYAYAQTHTAVKVIMCVGGGIDFLLGTQRRAPLLFRRFGVEWLWRLIHQPSRWRRIYHAVIVFPYLMLRYHD